MKVLEEILEKEVAAEPQEEQPTQEEVKPEPQEEQPTQEEVKPEPQEEQPQKMKKNKETLSKLRVDYDLSGYIV